MPPTLNRIAKAVVSLAGVLVALLLIAELVLRGAALFVSDRSGTAHGGSAKFRVLALGDSHTYGAGVEGHETYPAHLQALLDERSPGVFSVINKGIPGFSTGQVRSRLERAVETYDPNLVLFWAGINDVWNVTELHNLEVTWAEKVDGFATKHIKLYKMFRVRRHDRALEDRPDSAEGRPSVDPTGDDTRQINWGDSVEEVRLERQDKDRQGNDEVHERRVEANYEAMVAWLQALDVCVGFIEYPIDARGFKSANKAMRKVAVRHEVPIVRSKDSIKRLPKDELELLWALHPNARMYEEIARDIVPVVVASREKCVR